MENTEKQVPTQWFVFFENQLLMRKEKTDTGEVRYRVPYGTGVPVKPAAGNTVHEVPLSDEVTVRAFASEEFMETEEWGMISLRDSYQYITPEEYRAAGKVFQILYWDKHSHFCPACGTPTEQKASIMKKCPSCGYEIYPPIATAIIVLIRRGEEILLVRNCNFRGTFYGLVAGFLEPGETLEQCVQREVMEETGLRVKNVTYFGNQSWPYPCGLMVGFIADYESGEIKLQKDELCAGAFYSKDNLPEIPQKLSIARRMIDWWIDN